MAAGTAGLISSGRSEKPRIKKFLDKARLVVPRSFWTPSEAGHNQEGKLELNELDITEFFATPKPTRFLQRVLQVATNPGDLVLDAFLGSGTTAAVAHKMGRQYIGIEKGDHAATLCVDRIRKVIVGENGGISSEIGWTGGGAFRFYTLDRQIDRKQIAGTSRTWRTPNAKRRRIN